jgi:hypothetical protein
MVILGIGKRNQFEEFEKQDELMRNQYYDPIEHFPDKIDQLLDALNRVIDCAHLYFQILITSLFSFT